MVFHLDKTGPSVRSCSAIVGGRVSIASLRGYADMQHEQRRQKIDDPNATSRSVLHAPSLHTSVVNTIYT